MSVYLEVAEQVIENAGVPLNSKQILQKAYDLNLLPSNLYGKTQHKTFHARISVDIRKNEETSPFYRAERGIFFLKRLRNLPHIPKHHKKGIHVVPRSRELNREPVLGINNKIIEALKSHTGFLKHKKVEKALSLNNLQYGDAKNFITGFSKLCVFVVVQKQEKILTYREGKYREDRDGFSNQRTIGFKTLVTANDKTFLDNEDHGVVFAGLSATLTDLGVPFETINIDEEKKSAKIQFILSPQDDGDVVCVVNYVCPSWFEPLKRTLAINDLSWLSTDHLPNNIKDFDCWSQSIIPELFSIYNFSKSERLQ
jgi:hypothetical protein